MKPKQDTNNNHNNNYKYTWHNRLLKIVVELNVGPIFAFL